MKCCKSYKKIHVVHYSTSGIGALEKDAKYVQINKEDFRTTIECHSSDFIVDFEHISQLFEKNS